MYVFAAIGRCLFQVRSDAGFHVAESGSDVSDDSGGTLLALGGQNDYIRRFGDFADHDASVRVRDQAGSALLSAALSAAHRARRLGGRLFSAGRRRRRFSTLGRFAAAVFLTAASARFLVTAASARLLVTAASARFLVTAASARFLVTAASARFLVTAASARFVVAAARFTGATAAYAAASSRFTNVTSRAH